MPIPAAKICGTQGKDPDGGKYVIGGFIDFPKKRHIMDVYFRSFLWWEVLWICVKIFW